MSDADGERLAPVTWLFGSPPQQPETEQPSPSARFDAARLDVARGALAEAEAAPARDIRDGFDRISNVAMHALGRRGMSVRELRERLLEREFDEHEVEAEIDRLESVGLLDDGELAETLVRTLRERKGFGRAALVAELKRRKLHPDAIDAALADLGDDELERAVELARKRAPQLRSLEPEVAKRRLGAFLMRKGYSGSVVGTAVDRALTPSGPVFR
ncbi:MAG TPA: regulatory protein RecX [Rhodoglobus sp.]|nr:regulatory protein RecX [Rhodoglobus sp.]